MKLPTVYKNTVRIWRARDRICISLMGAALVAGFSLPMSSKATVPISSLPDFGNLTNFAELGNQLNESAVTINGNVGVSENGTLTLASPSTINGDVYVASGATFSRLGTVTGSIFTGQNLAAEQSTVFSASSALAALPADQTVTGNQATGLSIDVPTGLVYVLDLNGGLNLSDQNITETGGGDLVINLASSAFNLKGTSSILGNPQNIFINYLGSGTVNSAVGDVVNGQVFIPGGAANLDGTWNGSIFGGNKTITMLADSTLNGVPIPEPSSIAMAAMGGISMIILRLRHGRLKH